MESLKRTSPIVIQYICLNAVSSIHVADSFSTIFDTSKHFGRIRVILLQYQQLSANYNNFSCLLEAV